MPTHYWGEEDFDWAGLDWCVNYLDTNLKRWGRINVRQTKEKWGCIRCYLSLGWSSLFSITHPGWVSYKVAGYPKWLITFDIYYLSRVIPFLFNWFILPYHKWLYRKLYSDCVKKYPHLRQEILCCADFRELLKGL